MLNLPEILSIPQLDIGELQPSPYFTGRKDLCDEIYEKLKNRKSLNIYALNGIGGIGKSEVAKQVSVRLKDNDIFQDGYLWLSLESEPKETIWADIAQQFNIFNLSKIASIQDQKTIFREIMKATNPLVILDNADNPNSLRIAYEALKGKIILITSRKKISMVVEAKDLDDLSDNDSVDLYCEIYCRKTGMKPESLLEFKEKHNSILKEIVNRLSGHPLSIEIAASLASYHLWLPDRILQKLIDEGINTVTLPEDSDYYKVERHRNIKRTFELALDQDISGIRESELRIKTLYSACASLCGEYFLFEEIQQVLNIFLLTYQDECQKTEQLRAEQGQRGQSPIMQLLNIEQDIEKHLQPDEIITDPDPKGIVQVHQMLLQPESIRMIVDNLITVQMIKVNKTGERYRFHPLLREYAWDILPEYLTDNIWKAVAEWNAHKAQKLRDNPGDQLQNFRFFLNVCKDRELPEEFDTILFSILGYLHAQGMWVLAIELLELGKNWLLDKKNNKSILAKILKRLGDLLNRKGDDEKAKEYLLKSKELYTDINDQDSIAWITYWLGGVLYIENELNQFIHSLKNYRFSTIFQISDVVGAEAGNISNIIDPILFPNYFWFSRRIDLLLKIGTQSISNLNRRLLSLINNRIRFSKFDYAHRLLPWTEKLQKIDFDFEIQSVFYEANFYFNLFKNNLEEAEFALENYLKLEAKLERTNTSMSNIFTMQGLLNFEKKNYEKAVKYFMEADDEYEYVILSSILAPHTIKKDKISEIAKQLSEKIKLETSSVAIAYFKAIMAVYELFYNQDTQNHTSSLETYFQAVLYLEEHQRVELRFLKVIEPIIREKIGDESFFKTKYQLNKNYEIFRPSTPIFPENLPKIVKSTKDNRLMVHIPGGMCPIEKDDLEGLENIWLSQYYLDLHPVTNKDYANFIAETGHTPPENWENGMYAEAEAFLPVTNITLNDAEAYCNWSGKVLPQAYELKRASLLHKGIDIDSEWGNEISVAEAEQWLENFYEKLPIKSENEGNVKLFPGTHEEKKDAMNSFFDRLPWNNSVQNISAYDVLGVDMVTDIKPDDFLNLISTSISIEKEQKETIICNFQNYNQENIKGVIRFLLEERKQLLELDPNFNTEIYKLIEYRWKEWSCFIQKQFGIDPTIHITDKEKQRYCSQNPFDYCPAFDRFFPRDFNFQQYIFNELSDENKTDVMTFFQYLSGTVSIPAIDKRSIVDQIMQADLPDYEMHSLGQKFLEIIKEIRKSKHEPDQIASWLVKLQEAWAEWKSVSDHIVEECKKGKIIFKGKEKILELLKSEEADNPFTNPIPWDFSLESEIDIRLIIPDHPETVFDEKQFLNLLANSISLNKTGKYAVLQSITRLSQERVDGLFNVFLEEKNKLSQMPLHQWHQLQDTHKKHRLEWDDLISNLIKGKEIKPDTNNTIQENENYEGVLNPFHTITPWDFYFDEKPDIKLIIPDHETDFDENQFFNFLSASLSLSKNEKLQVIKEIPKLSQEQLDGLIKIFTEERIKFSEISIEHWFQLTALHKQNLSDWKEVIHSILSGEPLMENQKSESQENEKDKIVSRERNNDINISNIDFSLMDNPIPVELEENPSASPPACHTFLPDEIDIRWIIPDHPKTFFSENHFIQLLAGFVSLKKEEKRHVFEAIPKLSQDQIDQLISVFLEEKKTFMDFDRKYLPELKKLCKQNWLFWPELVFELLPLEYSQLEVIDSKSSEISYLEGKIWHWTSTRHYKTKIPALAGGPIVNYAAETLKDNFYPIRVDNPSAFTKTDEKSLYWGFRCCIPVFTNEDMENLKAVDC